MKRAWSVTMVAAVLLGCQSAQPTTNPFLRTAVPPPSTGAGAVVVPGEQYYPGAPPPIAGTPAVAPAVPVTTPAAPPPVITTPMAPAPTPVMPPRDKFQPPGGSFQYNQSSLEPSQSVDPDRPSSQAVQVGWTKSGTQPLDAQLADAIEGDAPSDKLASRAKGGVTTASYRTVETVESAGDSRADAGLEAADEAAADDRRAAPKNQLRIVADDGARPAADVDPAVKTPSKQPAFRVTVGRDQPLKIAAGQPAFRDVTPVASASQPTHVSIVTGDTVSDATENAQAKTEL